VYQERKKINACSQKVKVKSFKKNFFRISRKKVFDARQICGIVSHVPEIEKNKYCLLSEKIVLILLSCQEGKF